MVYGTSDEERGEFCDFDVIRRALRQFLRRLACAREDSHWARIDRWIPIDQVRRVEYRPTRWTFPLRRAKF